MMNPNAQLSEQTRSALEAEGFEVVLVPSPGRYHSANGEIGTASHMNFFIGNEVVVVLTYGTP